MHRRRTEDANIRFSQEPVVSRGFHNVVARIPRDESTTSDSRVLSGMRMPPIRPKTPANTVTGRPLRAIYRQIGKFARRNPMRRSGLSIPTTCP